MLENQPMATDFNPGPLSLIWDSKHTIPSKRKKKEKRTRHRAMTCRDLTGHLSFLGLRLQHRALVEEAICLKAEAIRGGGGRKQTENKANGEEKTKPRRSVSAHHPCHTCLHHCLLPLKSLHVSRVCNRSSCCSLLGEKQTHKHTWMIFFF